MITDNWKLAAFIRTKLHFYKCASYQQHHLCIEALLFAVQGHSMGNILLDTCKDADLNQILVLKKT